MKKIYEKSEENFAYLWIAIYCVGMTIAENISQAIGIESVVTAPFVVALTVIAYLFVSKNGLNEKFGLCKVEGSAKKFLFFIPLLLICTVNFWWGVSLKSSVTVAILLVIRMIGAGFMEEMIFRGFLFKALCKSNVKSAIVISSITFGVGHILNLARGKDLAETLFQMTYAVAIGFVFTILVYREKSIWPCIITHMIINISSLFGNEAGETFSSTLAQGIFLIIVSIAYALYILKVTGKVESNEKLKVVHQ